MLIRLTFAAAVTIMTTSFTTQAQALPPLEDNTRVQTEFLAAAVGDAIRKNCDDISARIWRALSKARQLERYALGLGYTDDQITAMRKDPAAKARLRNMRDTYLTQNGVTVGDAESYCRLGREEIAKNTLTGWLLREN